MIGQTSQMPFRGNELDLNRLYDLLRQMAARLEFLERLSVTAPLRLDATAAGQRIALDTGSLDDFIADAGGGFQLQNTNPISPDPGFAATVFDTLRVDSSHGLRLTNTGSGIATLDAWTATQTVPGIVSVSTAGQDWQGPKAALNYSGYGTAEFSNTFTGSMSFYPSWVANQDVSSHPEAIYFTSKSTLTGASTLGTYTVVRDGDIASGTPDVMNLAGGANDLIAGMSVTGTGIPGGTTVVAAGGSGVTLSANATATGTNTLTFTDTGGGLPLASGIIGFDPATLSLYLGVSRIYNTRHITAMARVFWDNVNGKQVFSIPGYYAAGGGTGSQYHLGVSGLDSIGNTFTGGIKTADNAIAVYSGTTP